MSAAAKEQQQKGFRPLNEASLMAYIRATPALATSLGSRLNALTVKEVGDGNLNLLEALGAVSTLQDDYAAHDGLSEALLQVPRLSGEHGGLQLSTDQLAADAASGATVGDEVFTAAGTDPLFFVGIDGVHSKDGVPLQREERRTVRLGSAPDTAAVAAAAAAVETELVASAIAKGGTRVFYGSRAFFLDM